MKIKKYENFIFEGRGISDVIKEYSEIIYDQFDNKEEYFLIDLEYVPLPLTNLRINFKFSNKYEGSYNPVYSFFNDDTLNGIHINIIIDKNDIDKLKTIGLIAHELTHVKEYYEVQKRIKTFEVKIKPTWIDIKQAYQELNIQEDETFYKFIYLIYLSLDTEMNARVSQIYHYLYNFKIKDKDTLFKKAKEHKNWEFLKLLENFNVDSFIQEMIQEVELIGFLKLTNELIDKFKEKEVNKNTKSLIFINRYVSNIEDLIEFYTNWKDYFNMKVEKHIEKFKTIIIEIIEDLNGNRPYNELYRNVI